MNKLIGALFIFGFIISTSLLGGAIPLNYQLAHAQPYGTPPNCGTPPFLPCDPTVGPNTPSGYCPPGEVCNPLGSDTFEDLLEAITNFLFVISIPIVSIMVLYGGFQILTAAGSPEKIEKGKKTIIYSVVGFVVILLANGVALVIKDILT